MMPDDVSTLVTRCADASSGLTSSLLMAEPASNLEPERHRNEQGIAHKTSGRSN